MSAAPEPMLNVLRIRNLALVADLTLEFRPGFNAITGETGAGKSILIGALNLLLGGRADRTLLRAGTEACTVEAVLDVRRLGPRLSDFLAENGLEAMEDAQLLLKRTFTAAGANRQFVNGSPASLQTLSALGEWLVDIHGPHDHQSLFRPARQLALLDAHANLGSLVTAFTEVLDRRNRLEADKAALIVDDAAYARQLELLRHQVSEITAANLRPGEEEDLEREHGRARNAARLLEVSQEALHLLAEGDDALVVRAGQVGRLLHELERLDPSGPPFGTLHAAAIESWRDLQVALAGYAERVDLDPSRLQELEERVNLLQSLRRKYGATAADILAFGQEAQAKLAQWEGREAELHRLQAEIEAASAELQRRGAALTAARQRALPRLSRAVSAELRDLGFARAEFAAELRPLETPLRSGVDQVEFLFAPNPGEPRRPLRAIASSGEIARVMLAIKTVLAAEDDIPVLVFDEVDANVGGETAHAVGAKMREIGRGRQAMGITHLAPVAAAGDAHFVVTKVTRDGRTLTEIRPVEGRERVAELARMLGGGTAAQRHAEALLAERRSARSGDGPAAHG